MGARLEKLLLRCIFLRAQMQKLLRHLEHLFSVIPRAPRSRFSLATRRVVATGISLLDLQLQLDVLLLGCEHLPEMVRPLRGQHLIPSADLLSQEGCLLRVLLVESLLPQPIVLEQRNKLLQFQELHLGVRVRCFVHRAGGGGIQILEEVEHDCIEDVGEILVLGVLHVDVEEGDKIQLEGRESLRPARQGFRPSDKVVAVILRDL
mmetsp:Transcript_46829/g.114078  ORF Transcript_46829/g.114078 Transcript_46829/m.114078 type:complete len:206 (+) Transcript_46829:3087-3704(+)